jgi:hypothetical protein
MVYQDGWGYGPGWGGGLASLPEASIHAGRSGHVCGGRKKLVWRGAVSNAVELTLSLDRSEKKIQKSVEKLQNYPPNSKNVNRNIGPNRHFRLGLIVLIGVELILAVTIHEHRIYTLALA